MPKICFRQKNQALTFAYYDQNHKYGVVNANWFVSCHLMTDISLTNIIHLFDILSWVLFFQMVHISWSWNATHIIYNVNTIKKNRKWTNEFEYVDFENNPIRNKTIFVWQRLKNAELKSSIGTDKRE